MEGFNVEIVPEGGTRENNVKATRSENTSQEKRAKYNLPPSGDATILLAG